MYQVIIVDDEAKIRNGIAGLFPWSQLGFEIAGCFSNGKPLTTTRLPTMWT